MHKKLYIHDVASWGVFAPDDTEAMTSAKARIDRKVLRRMSPTAVVLHALLTDYAAQDLGMMVLGTTFGESIGLEKYLDSFPHPSPMHFQNSVHPSSLLQWLIHEKQSIEELIPLAGECLSANALAILFADHSARKRSLIIVDKMGTWLKEIGQSSRESFALGMNFSPDSRGALGAVVYEEEESDYFPENQLFVEAIQNKESMTVGCPHGGRFVFTWL